MDASRLKPVVEELMSLSLDFRLGRVLTTAVSREIFERIPEGGGRIEDWKRDGEDTEALARICNVLAGANLLIKEGDAFRCPADVEALLTDESSFDLRPILRLYHRAYEMWGNLDRAVEMGQSISFEREEEKWSADFIAAMEARAHFSREPVARALEPYLGDGRVLDLGGGSGVFSRALLKQCPEASGVVADLPGVIEETEQYIERENLSNRMEVAPLDLVEEKRYGEGYDLVLLSAVLHIYGPETNERIVRRAARALAPGGFLAIREYILSEDRTHPPGATLFNIHMFLATDEGEVYTEREYRDWLEAAGLAFEKRIGLEETAGLLVGRKPGPEA